MGEVGTEKQQFAKFIHLLSKRASNRFLDSSCDIHHKFSTEVGLFGHEKGVVKGSMSYRRPGLFENANMGSVFLESISYLSSATIQQIKKAMIDGSIQRIGGDMAEKVDTRVFLDIELDNRGKPVLPKLKKQFANMNVMEIVIPPLRERLEDIPLFCGKRLSPKAYERLCNRDWPGNVKQLRESLGLSSYLWVGDTIYEEDLILPPLDHFQDPYSALPEPEDGFDLPKFISKVKKQLIMRAIFKAGFNQSEAARMLGVSGKMVRKFWDDQTKL